MPNRLNIKNLIPDAYQLLIQLSQFVANAGIDPLQQELIKIRASQLTEELTVVANHGLSEDTYKQAVGYFGEMMTAKLIIAVININSFNRLGISQRLHPIS